MTPFNIYRKTMIFSWMKFGIGMLILFVCLAIGGLTWFVIGNMEFSLLTSIAIACGAFLVIVAIGYLIMSRLGYSIKTGHLAIIERAHGGQDVPSNPVEFSKTVVSGRFGSSRKFYMNARSIASTIRELVRVIMRGFSLTRDTPDVHSGRWLKYLISLPALHCADECCMTYALRHHDYEVNAAIVDALTILVQSWDRFINKALKVSIGHILLCLATFAIFFVPGFFICRNLGVNTIPWLGTALVLTFTVKIAFFDSYVLSKIVCDFLTIADETQIEAKNYVKLDSWSKQYASLRRAAEKAAEKAEDEADRAERAAKKAAAKEKKQEKAAESSDESKPSETESATESTEAGEDSRQ
ncbi:MAG: hypothetical protein IJU23_05440 [Proteobacteria bacterium]|nr:hypothetical protein [Pseudomonadota bacterium]